MSGRKQSSISFCEKMEGSWGFLDGSVVKNLPAVQETQEMQVRSLGWKDLLEKEMATHSSIPAWKILCSEESGMLPSAGSHRAGHD